MDIWKIIYITESGYEGEVEVSAVNKFMAWDIFEDIEKSYRERRPLIPSENLHEKPR